jgi:type I restriction enzyme S subunit
MAAVDEGRGVIADLQTRPHRKVKRGYTYFEEGDVLFAKITPSMQNGKSAIAKGLIDGFGFGSTEFHVLRPSSRVIPKWVHLFVRQRSFRDEAMLHFRGAVGQQRVPTEFLESYSFPLPPLDEQRRIVARIEELFARIEEARRLRVAADQDAEELAQAALAVAFESLRSETEQTEQLGDLASEMRNGMSKRVWVEPPDGVASLNIANITQQDFSIDSCRRVLFNPERHTRYLSQTGDLLVCNVNGSPRLVGAVAVFPGASEPVVIDHNITRLRLKPKVMPEFIAYHLREPMTRVAIEARFATSSGQSYLPQKKLTTVPVLVPPLAEQHRIVEYLDGVQAQVAELKRLQAESAAELERLSGAVLARAFRGE